MQYTAYLTKTLLRVQKQFVLVTGTNEPPNIWFDSSDFLMKQIFIPILTILHTCKSNLNMWR